MKNILITALVIMSLLESAIVFRNARKAEQIRIQIEALKDDFSSNVKEVAEVSYMAGCVTVAAESRHLEMTDPMMDLYRSYCAHYAKLFKDTVEFKK